MEWISIAQAELKRQKLAGWLIYDFRGLNPFARRFVDLGDGILSRRWFCFVPSEGKPTLLVHAIERGSLPDLPFEIYAYSSHQSLTEALAQMLPKAEVALEYSPNNDIPYVSYVDAGTVDMLRSLGVVPVSSANVLQAFSAWTPEQLAQHQNAAEHVLHAKDLAFDFIKNHTAKESLRETEVQRVITDYFDQERLEYDHPPIIGFGPNAASGHYSPQAGSDRALQQGDAILIDLWAKLPEKTAPYADITWMGAYGQPSEHLQEVFSIVRNARDLGIKAIREALETGRKPQGFEIDRAVRDFIAAKGYGDAFVHRTGHSLGTRATHGDAVHLDDFETCDTRELAAGIGVTIEPGIYLDNFGVRSEINLVVEEGGLRVTTDCQRELIIVPD